MEILKPGQEGFGYLVEWDAGFINPNQKENKLIIEQMATAVSNPSPPFAPYPFYLYATLQKAGVENKNGRIYPMEVLAPEVEKYNTLIPDRSTNEYNHPDCVRSTTEVLTISDGWKSIMDVSVDDSILTYNPETCKSEYKKIDRKIDEEYNGKMIQLKGRNINIQTTPNHKWWCINKNTNKGKFITSQEIFEAGTELSNWFIPKTATYSEGINYNTFKINGFTKKIKSHMLQEKYSTDIEIDSKIFFQFMGIFLAEGFTTGSRGCKDKAFNVVITQKNEEKIDKIRELMKLLPFEYREVTRNNGTKDFIIADARLHGYLSKLGNSYTKYIPKEIKCASPQLLTELFEWFKMGDGRTIGKIHKQSDVFSISKQLIDDLHEILIKMGGSGNIRREERNKDRNIKDHDGTIRTIRGENSKPMYFLNISSTNGVWLDKRFLDVSEVEYSGKIYCVVVPNHVFYAREFGVSMWTGNSSIIDLERISHRIVKTWWEGPILMGQLEILTSPAFRNSGQVTCVADHAALLLSYGITLGISSRGVGSLKNQYGKNIVQSDFELICFDLVSAPSTPGAYLFKDLNMKDKLPEMIKDRKNEVINESNIKIINHLNDFLL